MFDKEVIMSRAHQITVEDIAAASATAVARALHAREAAGVELTAEDLNQVSGGRNNMPIVAGAVNPTWPEE